MEKTTYRKKLFWGIIAIALMILTSPATLKAQWTIYDGSVMPDAFVPAFMTASVAPVGTATTAYNQIVADPVVSGNSFLSMNTGTVVGNTFLWRMNWAADGHNVTVTELTAVMRVRAHPDRTHAIDFDLHFNNRRFRVTINRADGHVRVRAPDHPSEFLTIPMTEWNIFRFTMTPTQVRLFVNEDPTPVLTVPITEGTASINRHMRIGDGATDHHFGADIDWLIWDVTGAHAPGQGTALPTGLIGLPLSSEATLSQLNMGATAIPGFMPATHTYNIVLPAGTTEVPIISAVASHPAATVAVTQATSLPGTATVLVTAQNGTSTLTYTVNMRTASTDASLSDLRADGTAIAGFAPATLTYNVVLPAGTTVPPVISAATTFAGANIVVTQATAIPGAATVVVTAEDGVTTSTYTVNMRTVSTDATLSDLRAGGTTIAGFAPATLTYNVVLPAGTTVVPVISATAAFAGANVVVTQAAAIPGAATVVVTAEDNLTSQTYTVNFTSPPAPVIGWTIYDGSVMPNAFVPAFMTASMVGGTATDFSQIVADPNVQGNSFLSMNTGATVGNTFLWRMNWAAPPTGHGVEVTALTAVMRVRGHADRAHTLDFDMDFNGQRARVSINTEDGLIRVRQGIGPTAPVNLAEARTNWNVFRFTMTATEVRLFVNENPVPVITITPATGSNRHIRIGDGDTGATFGADIDWLIWDVTGAHAPGQGNPIPAGLIVAPPTLVGPVAVNEFTIYPNPAVNWITIAAAENMRDMTLEIVNTAGQLILRQQMLQQQELIDVSGLAPGTYIISLKSENGVSRKLFIKQ